MWFLKNSIKTYSISMLRSSTRAEKVPTLSSRNMLYLIHCCTSASEQQSANVPTGKQNLHTQRTNVILTILFRSLHGKTLHSELTLSHVQNGSSNLQPLVPGSHLQAVQQAHSVSSVLLCIKLRPSLIRDYRQRKDRDWTHIFTLDCRWY